MTCEQYWEGDPYLVTYYRKAHNLKTEEENQKLWLQGLYIQSAFASVIGNMFSKGKQIKYIESPVRLTPLTDREKENKAEQERRRYIESRTRWMREWKKKYKDKGQ